jgi:hypothetical protein
MAVRFQTRRQFLQAAGVSLALPLLESNGTLHASFGHTAPRRMAAICLAYGLHAPFLLPKKMGRGFETTPYLATLGNGLAGRFTVVSGTSHPEVTLGHASDACFLTAARNPGGSSFRNSVSLDQFMVEKLKPSTRFPYLALSTRSGSISYTRAGVQIPSESKPSRLFTRLFINGNAAQVDEQVRRLEDGRSIMDTVLAPAKRLLAKASAADRPRLEQYFTAVREVELRLANGQEWARKPKPIVDYAPPNDVADPNDDVTRFKLMLDLVSLAFQTDSTRFVSLYVSPSSRVQPIPGISIGFHGLSHHGQDPEKLTQLKVVQMQQMQALGVFLNNLRSTPEGDETVFDRTTTLIGAAMGNASSHNCKNLPIILAGGGFQHGQHIAFDAVNNTPLCRLYVSILQRFGIEEERFATGNGTLPGLELA